MRAKAGLLLTLLVLTPCLASVFKADTNIGVDSGEVIDQNVYYAGNLVNINGLVNGDAIIGANIVDVNGVINGDLLVGGNIVTINGNVSGDIRSGCSVLYINGNVGGEVLAGAGQVTINQGSSIGELNVGAASVLINGEVKGNVTASVENITITDNAIIGGSVLYYSDNEAVIENPGVITGTITQKEGHGMSRVAQPWALNFGWNLAYASFLFLVIGLFADLLVGLVLIRLSEKSVKDLKTLMNKDLFDRGLKGFAFLILVPIAAIIGMITIIAMPLSFITLGVYGLVLYLASIAGALFVGTKLIELFKMKAQPLIVELIIGLVVVKLINLIPFVGWFINFIIWLIGIGAIMKLSMERFDECKKKKIC